MPAKVAKLNKLWYLIDVRSFSVESFIYCACVKLGKKLRERKIIEKVMSLTFPGQTDERTRTMGDRKGQRDRKSADARPFKGIRGTTYKKSFNETKCLFSYPCSWVNFASFFFLEQQYLKEEKM